MEEKKKTREILEDEKQMEEWELSELCCKLAAEKVAPGAHECGGEDAAKNRKTG